MKAKKMLLSITIYCLILLGCTACANRTASNKDKAEKQEDIVKVTETTRTNEVITSNSIDVKSYDEVTETKIIKKKKVSKPIKLSNTYKTKEAEVNQVDAPEFSFDDPDNWSITPEIVNGEGLLNEVLSITNKRGVEITYVSLGAKEVTDAGRYMYKVDISKIGKSSFVPGYVSATDYSSLGKFVVAEIKKTGSLSMDTDEDYKNVDGEVSYAVLPKSLVGKKEDVRDCGDYKGFSFIYFSYPSAHAFFATSPDGKFTEQEEREVIAILSSFRE